MTDPDTIAKAADHAASMLAALGIHGDTRTPVRLVRALDELARCRDTDPARHLAVQFPPTTTQPGLIVVTDVPFVSLCEHHVLPFTGVATAAYLPAPGQSIAGLSKLARLVQEFAARPQIQERLTDQITTGLHTALSARGAACAIRGQHSCMALRGVRTGHAAAMVTVQYAGELTQSPWREDFMARLNTSGWRG